MTTSGAVTSRTEKFRAAAALPDTTNSGAERITTILKELDTDGDGKFSTQEVVIAVRKLMSEQTKVRRLRWLVAGLVGLYIATLAIIFGLAVGGSEITKETNIEKDGVSTKKGDGNVKIRVQEDLELYELSNLFSQPLSNYEKLEALFVPHDNETFGYYRVAAIINKPESLDFVFLDDSTLSVDPDGYSLTDRNGDTLRNITFDQEFEEAEARKDGGAAKGRRLNPFYDRNLAIRCRNGARDPRCFGAGTQRVFTGVTHSFVVGGRRVDVPFNSPLIRSYVG
ncbi:unnamed protein product [Vitrella brassicaformis CCMP3155]|uniref:EF-hand domain-containing protein n=1 Tax=Vitrella brassicaformis (strain CCMP3155) TaxID=1169540 RepID=A0A0G4EC98_VITBC|nr:unnamed protein product [Vitrella brassicaformis CCMP3155]|mmetsp:Transcript_34852/g.86482  ORF Transcript_34852/g.86482 Transcript_34852/m.86482 type:complete len:282 (-) Transcript_34852:1106-1951(-)|eukprot:CEL93331.1 unnamed protein product [Vitrella brassicaformis CCMP3155]